MSRPKIYVHGSYIGNTGFNNHTRDFFRELSKYCQLKVRNFTIGNSWSGMSETPHDNEPHINDVDKSILYEQNLWIGDNKRENFKMYQSEDKEFEHDFNIVLSETNHHFYYDKYEGPKIAYNVWESTLQPEEFFKGLAMGKRALTAAFKTLKTKPATPNGRINEECIILGAF